MGKSKEVIKYDVNNKEICRYDSAKIAYETDGINSAVFMKNINNEKKFFNGFRYAYSGKITNEINKENFNFKCPYCDEKFDTYNGLCKHVFRFSDHKCESKEQLLADFAYNGIRPTCKCGCGEYTEISYEGGAHFREYVKGHNSKVNNNWGHNENAIKKSSKTRKEQYENGNRVQWNKGKKWEDVFDENKINELLETYKNEERNKKISEKLKGVPKSEEHKQKLKEVFNTEQYKECKSKELLNRVKSQTFSMSSKLEKMFIEQFIKPLEIEYQTQYYIKEIKQYCDVYIPSKNLIVECDGSFWHCDPRLFPNGPIYDYQKNKIERDKIKTDYLINKGYELLRFWEVDIIDNPELVKEKLNEKIK